jgi:hypothetical protein
LTLGCSSFSWWLLAYNLFMTSGACLVLGESLKWAYTNQLQRAHRFVQPVQREW